MGKQESTRRTFAHLQVPVFSTNKGIHNNRHKEFLEIAVLFSLHTDSVTICQVFL